MKIIELKVKDILLLSCLSLSACTLGPDYYRPQTNLPESFRESSNLSSDVSNLAWWSLFQDSALQNLIQISLKENQDLIIAAERVEAAKALLGITRADQFPRLDLSAQAQRADASDKIFAFETKPYNNFGIFGELSFELDIWGKLSRATEAQRAELLSSEYARRAVTVTLISQVATTYLDILGLENRLKIAKKTYENRRGATKIIKARFDKGVIPELDYNQAQIEESEAAISISSFERQIKFSENALSVLLGRAPYAIERSSIDKISIATNIPTGFPASLLERRPDLLATEEQVKASIAKIGFAEADQLPSFNLFGVVGLQSKDIADTLKSDALTWSVGGDIFGPLIDWGKSASEIEFAEAQARIATEQYKKVVIQAAQEVDDSLTSIRTFKIENEQRLSQVKAASNAARLSRARYDEGVAPYLEVLDIERSLFEAELGASNALQAYYSSIVQLYKALGGGWNQEFSNTKPTTTP